jgi:hypothetical protein
MKRAKWLLVVAIFSFLAAAAPPVHAQGVIPPLPPLPELPKAKPLVICIGAWKGKPAIVCITLPVGGG